MEIRSGGLLFTSKFDSGNLTRVERVVHEEEVEAHLIMSGQEVRPDHEYSVWTRPDCAGTEFENGNRTWFYFAVKGYIPGRLLRITIMNLNRQAKLYSQGYAPLYKVTHSSISHPKWQRVRDRPSWETVEGQFKLIFTHRFTEPRGSATYFAFCFPWSYSECQEHLAALDYRFESCTGMGPKEAARDTGAIYYRRELLCLSYDRLRVDLLTVTDCANMEEEQEPRFDQHLFPEKSVPRPRKFRRKRVYMVSSRVHPGETPASYVFNGFLEFILRPDDPRARQLRRQYVFKLIPILNPDGVVRGHYRTDARGVNLNRMYLDPNPVTHPSIYASKSLLVHHHVANRMSGEELDQWKVPIHAAIPHQVVNLEPSAKIRPQKPVVIAPPPEYVQSKNRTFHMVHGETNGCQLVEVEEEQSLSSAQPLQQTPRLFKPVSSQSTGDTVMHRYTYSSAIAGVIDLQEEVKTVATTATTTNPSPHSITTNTVATTSITTTTSTPSSAQSSTTPQQPQPSVQQPQRQGRVFRENSALSQQLIWTSAISKSKPTPRSVDNGDGPLTDRPKSSVRMSSPLKPAIVSVKFTDKTKEKHLGNEGSDGDSDGEDPFDPTHPLNPHLCDPHLLDVPPKESGIAFYVDLHGHCSRRGCFIYGNSLDNEEQMMDNLLFVKLIALNTAHFDFSGCNFSTKNMYQKDKRDGLSKEGAGRVAIWKHLGLVHSYTLECNYNTGRTMNHIAPATGDNGRATPPPPTSFPPKYTQAHFEDVGRALAVAGLDIYGTNPWTRIPDSEYRTFQNLREYIRRYLRNMRGGPRLVGQAGRSNSTLTRSFVQPSGNNSSTSSGSRWSKPAGSPSAPVTTNTPARQQFTNGTNSGVTSNNASGVTRSGIVYRSPYTFASTRQAPTTAPSAQSGGSVAQNSATVVRKNSMGSSLNRYPPRTNQGITRTRLPLQTASSSVDPSGGEKVARLESNADPTNTTSQVLRGRAEAQPSMESMHTPREAWTPRMTNFPEMSENITARLDSIDLNRRSNFPTPQTAAGMMPDATGDSQKRIEDRKLAELKFFIGEQKPPQRKVPDYPTKLQKLKKPSPVNGTGTGNKLNGRRKSRRSSCFNFGHSNLQDDSTKNTAIKQATKGKERGSKSAKRKRKPGLNGKMAAYSESDLQRNSMQQDETEGPELWHVNMREEEIPVKENGVNWGLDSIGEADSTVLPIDTLKSAEDNVMWGFE